MVQIVNNNVFFNPILSEINPKTGCIHNAARALAEYNNPVLVAQIGRASCRERV